MWPWSLAPISSGRLVKWPCTPLGNVGRLLLDVDEHLAAVGVEADVVGDEADVAAGVADDLLVVDGGLGGDLAEHHDHVCLGAGLARHLALGVLGEARVEDGVGHLVAQLVGVTLVHGLGGEEERLRRHFYLPAASVATKQSEKKTQFLQIYCCRQLSTDKILQIKIGSTNARSNMFS
jgi:hypothetical protein